MCNLLENKSSRAIAFKNNWKTNAKLLHHTSTALPLVPDMMTQVMVHIRLLNKLGKLTVLVVTEPVSVNLLIEIDLPAM